MWPRKNARNIIFDMRSKICYLKTLSKFPEILSIFARHRAGRNVNIDKQVTGQITSLYSKQNLMEPISEKDISNKIELLKSDYWIKS